MMQFEDLFPAEVQVGFHAEVKIDFAAVAQMASLSTALWLRDWTSLVMKTAKASIVTDRRPSLPGHPPHTKGKPGHNIRDAIKSRVEKSQAADDLEALLFDTSSVVYVDQQMVGDIGAVMEQGGFFRGRHYAARPFLEPAMQQNFTPFFNIVGPLELAQSDVVNTAESALESLFN